MQWRDGSCRVAKARAGSDAATGRDGTGQARSAAGSKAGRTDRIMDR